MNQTADIRIQHISDAHLEFVASPRLKINRNTTHIVLTGDIHVGPKAADEVIALAMQHPTKTFLFIPGNHERYHQQYQELQNYYTRAFANIANAHFLDNGQYLSNGVRFIGTTLWPGFDYYGDGSCSIYGRRAELAINDFLLIRDGDRAISWKAMRKLHKASVHYIEERLKEPFTGKTVVCTHWPPIRKCLNPKFREDEITPYFCNRLEWLVEKYTIDLWLYGHHHYHQDFKFAGTRFVSNQQGYPSEDDIDLNNDLLITL